MPPKAKFTKEEIIAIALEIVKKSGMSALTARELGAALGSSARPIFTIFKNMEEVQQEVKKAAKELYSTYIKRGLSKTLAFKGVGTQYILFAKEEPKLFQLLFMTEVKQASKLPDLLSLIDENSSVILNSIEEEYHLDRETSWKLYQHLWIYTHGIGSLIATNVYTFTEQEIDTMISEIFISLLKNLR